MRRYLVFALVAFAAYSLVAPLLKVAMETIPSTTAVFISNSIMFVLLGAILVYRGTSPTTYLSHPKTRYILAWGILLAIGILAYYRALELGPVSVVVPIYGLFIAVSSVIGIVAFDENVTARKGLSIFFAVLAVVLMSL
ncbi:EamA family transporter [Natronobacterium texcoconense]|uniref:Transporter family protein n=1 Tax=Natronobacterium texcoconense TaxID=1095778 RepID=A0A1H1AG40_NATTX|nr:EamA family transporter [Natronobacterium texcoconense]SDQ38665.1 transporter family protein [Natronobacterium texcoconense]